MSRTTDQTYLVQQQYKNADNLRARMAIHERFSTNTDNLARWVFDRMALPEDARVLELGTGPARLWTENRERIPAGWHVTLSDLSPGMLEEAQQTTKDIDKAFDYKVIDAQDVPFEDDTFDCVVANHMLYHVPDLGKGIAEIRRVLKPGGKLYAVTNGEKHMRELEAFVAEQFAKPLGAEFEVNTTLSFRLENGNDLLGNHFDHVELAVIPNNALKVTEAEPFMAYIFSMNRWQTLLAEAGQDADALVRGAREELERCLAEDGSVHVTKATGLFTAW